MLPVFGSNWSSRRSRPRRVVVHARRRAGRAVAFVAILAGAAFPGILLAAGQVSPPAPRPVVVSAEVEAIIHPVSAEYHGGRASSGPMRAGAALVVFTLEDAGRPGRFHPHHRHEDARGQDAGRRVRRPGRRARGVGRVPAHDRRRRGGHGAGHAHRRGPPGDRRRREDGRDDGEEGRLGRGGLRTVARHAARPQRRARRGGRRRRAAPSPRRRRSRRRRRSST